MKSPIDIIQGPPKENKPKAIQNTGCSLSQDTQSPTQDLARKKVLLNQRNSH